jgi:hypothetical protein
MEYSKKDSSFSFTTKKNSLKKNIFQISFLANNIITSLACAIGPSVNTQLRSQLVFPSKPKFCNLFKFAATKSTKKTISFHTFSAENCEINSIIKSGLLRAFQQHQEHLQIPIGFSVSILFSFH